MEVSVIVRRRAAPRLQARLAALVSGQRGAGYMSRDEFAREHGADPADFARVRSFAQAQGLAVVQEHAARRTVVLSFALACGGTSLLAAQTGIASETVWDDGAKGGASGGGISSFFPAPTWQKGISAQTTQGKTIALTKRGVPDVAGDADPATGYDVRVDGSNTVVGGTSAVAPLWAALIARINQETGKAAGYINPRLYQNPQALRDITQGNNGDFTARAGGDACTGLGSPNGKALSAVI
jgi:hypothetical protein